MGIRCADHVTPFYPQKLALTSPTDGGPSVGIVRLRTKATEFIIIIIIIIIIMRYIIFQVVKFFYLSIYEMLPNTLNSRHLDIISNSYARRNYASDIFDQPSYFVGDYFVVTYFLPMPCHLL